MHVNYRIQWDTHDVNTLVVIVEALILWGVIKINTKNTWNLHHIIT